MKKLALLGLLLLVGCTDMKVDSQLSNCNSRVKVVELNDHGCVGGRGIHSFILKDTKTEKEFLVVEQEGGVAITPLQ